MELSRIRNASVKSLATAVHEIELVEPLHLFDSGESSGLGTAFGKRNQSV